jgi:alkaline phosphatase D
MDRPDLAPDLRRRDLLKAGAGAAAGLTLAGPLNVGQIARAARKPVAGEVAFEHGVASGFPAPRGITLWTRASELDRSSRLTLEVATDPDFARVVERRTVIAEKPRDFTVHTRVGGLKPDREYHYRFASRKSESPVGRFRTAPPPDSKRPVRIAFCSCQSWQAGYYTAQAGLAAEPDIDLVVFLGDYIYEYPFYAGEGPADRVDTTGRNGDAEVQRIDEYREKYRLYQSDPNLIAMQAAHPMVAIWDDHEVEDNFAGDEPDATQDDPSKTNQDTPRTVRFEKRRKAGFKAFFEAMPRIRREDDPNRIYERARLGGLVDLLLLDTRGYRDRQPCGGELLQDCPESDAPGRTILGGEQKAWLKNRLTSSQATWKLLGNQVMLMGLESAPGQTLNVDQWDGYAAERREILEHALAGGVENIVSLCGDIHTFFAGQATTTGNATGTPAATEFVGGSLTSLGIPETLGLPPGLPENQLASAILSNNPHIDYVEVESRGYGIVEVTESELRCEFRAPKTALEPQSPVETLARFRVPAGEPTVETL